jgi:phage virion morphogenesis protein
VTGARINANLDDKAIRDALGRLKGLPRDGLLKNIGEALLGTTLKRFRTETDPDGQPWHPLLPAYAAIKRGPGILRESARPGSSLMGTIVYQVRGNEVIVGSNVKYAAVHQFGATITPKTAKALVFRLGAGGGVVRVKSVTIPARPYLGFGRQDQEAVIEQIEFAVSRAV